MISINKTALRKKIHMTKKYKQKHKYLGLAFVGVYHCTFFVLHPGEIFGWGEKPDIMRFVGHDGVHLNDAGERAVRSIIQGRLHAFKLERVKAKEQDKSMDCGAGPDGPVERSEGVLEASQFVGFAGMMVANGLSYSKPKSSLAGDL